MTTTLEAPAPTTDAPTVTPAAQRRLPWDNLGTEIDQKMTAEEAIREGGLDWDVELFPVFTRIDKVDIEVPKRFSVMKDRNEILGMVSDIYVPFQNREAFTFADNIVDSSDAKYIRVGPLSKNRVVFLVMELPDEVVVAGHDTHKMYMVFTTSHNGTKAIGAYVTMIRMGCTNQMTMMRNTAPHSWSIPHVADVAGKVAAARESLQLAFAYRDEFASVGDELSKLQVSEDTLVGILESTLPKRPKTDEVIDSIRTLYSNSDTNGFEGTAWGALNAVTEFFDHHRDTRSQESVFLGGMNGGPAKARNLVTRKLLALAN